MSFSLDELAAMARGEIDPDSDGNAALLSDTAKQLLMAQMSHANDESAHEGRDENASIAASVKFGQTTAITINKDISDSSNLSDDISHHSGYSQYTLKSSRDPSAYDASGYDQMMTGIIRSLHSTNPAIPIHYPISNITALLLPCIHHSSPPSTQHQS